MNIDDDIKQELMDAFTDLYDEVEEGLAHLYKDQLDTDPDRLNKIFRAIHSMKGNAGMMQLDKIVHFAHSIENVAESLRSHRFYANEAVCEALQLGMDRLRDVHFREIRGSVFENLRETELIPLFDQLAESSVDTADENANKIMRALATGLSFAEGEKPEIQPTSNVFSVTIDDHKLHHDLAFFQELALQIDNQTNYWHGRSIQLFEWALKLNKIGGSPVSYEQFAAATYLHDIGMSFLPSEILSKPEALAHEERRHMQCHPQWGHDYLVRIPGWEEAALIILDHHERVDGTGYPHGKKDLSIHPGAKILAIIDAFFSMINSRADRNRRASIIRAISEINACSNTQFDSMWVQCFNHMIRSEVKDGLL